MGLGFKKSKGFSILEVMVAIFVMGVGLMALGSLQARVNNTQMDAYQRSQAMMMLDDFVTRMKMNKNAAPCYVTTSLGSAWVGVGETNTFNCSTGSVTQRAIAIADLTALRADLQGSFETNAAGNAGGMINGRGCVAWNATDESYTISISWQGSSDLVTPSNTCASSEYGGAGEPAAGTRRTVWKTIRFAELG